MSEYLSKSLEDYIQDKKTGHRGVGKQRKFIRKNKDNRLENRQDQDRSQKKIVLKRKPSYEKQPYNKRQNVINIENLEQSINQKEIIELFQSVGTVVQVSMDFGPDGEFRGSARVHFQRFYDAEKAVKEFNGSTIDGSTVKIALRK